MSITYRKALVLVENGAGDTAPTAAANAILVSNFTPPTPQGSLIDRRVVKQTLSPGLPSIGAKTYTMSFDCEWKGIEQASGLGVKVPEFHPLLIASGAKVTVYGTPVAAHVYSPNSSAGVDATQAVCVYAYQDGLLYKITDARVDWTITLTAGAAGVISFQVTGNYAAPTDAALPASPGYDATTVPGKFAGAGSFEFGGAARCIESFSLTSGNTIAPRVCANGDDGISGIFQTARAPGGSINPEMELVATENYLGHWSSTTTKILIASVDGNDVGKEGNAIAVIVLAAALTTVAPGERGGLAVVSLGYRCVETSASGDDEWSIAVA